MGITDVAKGNKVEIAIRSHIFESYVEDVGSDNVLLDIPVSYGQSAKLPTNQNYTMTFITDKGNRIFQTTVLGYVKKYFTYFMQVKLIEEIKSEHNRKAYRLECLLPIKFTLAESETTAKDSFDGITRDISVGGMYFASNVEIGEDSMIRCVLPLNKVVVPVVARILHKKTFPRSKFIYHYQVQFNSLSKEAEDTIGQFIFEEQKKITAKPKR
jgi:c-di-GMP-binding flagellar brake protein YcgR